MSSVFERFQKEREKLGLSLQDVADVLRISTSHLEAIESGRLQDLPKRVYSLGFIRNYANYLNIDHAEAVHEYKSYDTKAEKATTVHSKKETDNFLYLFFKETTQHLCISNTRLHYTALICVIIYVIFSVIR